MSINHFIDENQQPKLDLYANNIQAKKVSVEEEFDELKFKCQNGDVVNLSSLNNYGNGGNVLVSDGDGSVSWVEGVPSSSVDYNGNDPVAIGKIAIYGATNGKLIKDSSLSDTDILNKNGDTMNGNLDLQTNSLLNAGAISINSNTISSSGFLEFVSGNTERINFKSDSGILSLENANLGQNVNIELAQFQGTNFNILKNTGNVNFCAEANDIIEFTTDCFGANKKIILDPSASTQQLRDYNLDMNNNTIDNVSNVDTAILTTDTISSNNPSIDVLFTDLNMNNGDISAISNITTNNVYTTELLALAPATEIQVRNNLRMRGNDIVDTDNIEVNFGITTADIKTDTITANTGVDVKFNNNITLFGNDIIAGGNIQTSSLTATDFKSQEIDANAHLDFDTLYDVRNVATLTANVVDTQTTSTAVLNGGISPDIDVNSNLNFDNLYDVKNVNNFNTTNTDTTTLTIATTTKYISDVSQLPTAIGGFHLLVDNTSYIICGQIILTNGIQFGNNCSLSGVDFSASITFDETANDIIGFKSVDTNVYLSKLTIIGGGGRFSAVPSFTNGLFNCDNFDVAGGFPFYARNRRFKVDGCNFITPYSMGRVRGYATLNFNNNLISGTGAFDTYEGLEVIDGLSLEFLGNKLVLFRGGADPNSTAKMLRFGASIVVPVIPQKPEGLMSFNAVNVSGNIFHPRGNFENGIDFDPTSRTGLGVISSNTFIRSGGTAPLINYENVNLYDNYNSFSIETYTINSNVGVVDSEPNLKSIIQLSNTINSTTLTKLVCQDNNQIEPIKESSRFAIRLDLTGVSSAFVGNERITDDASGNDALILKADTLTAGNQTIYITDMSGKFNAIPTTFTGSIAGASTGGSLLFYWVYLEKDPRKLVLSANFDLNVPNNVGFSVSPNMDAMADSLCSVSSVSASAGAGSTLSVVCSKRYNEGDYIEFYASSTAGTINLVKAVISVK